MPRLKNTVHEKFAQLLALKHQSQHAAWLEAIGPQRAAKVLAKKKRATSLISAASKLAANPSIRARVEEIEAENEAECRWRRKQLLDFYCDVLERGAGTLAPEDRLCQASEETTVTHYNGKGEPVRTVHKKRLIMPAKMEAADGIRKMLGWDKVVKADQPEDDITELVVMIRRRSGGANALETPKPADAKALPDKTENTQPLEVLSSEHLPALPVSSDSSASMTSTKLLCYG